MKEPTTSTLVLAVAEIAGFSRVCRHKFDVDTFAMLDRFYHATADVIATSGGSLVKSMGDAVLMVFPEEKAKQAASCLLELQDRVQTVWSEFGTECTVRIHAHFGTVAAGPIGPAQPFDIVGNPVNELFLMPWDGPMFSEEMTRLINK